jgi:hypothetical protein
LGADGEDGDMTDGPDGHIAETERLVEELVGTSLAEEFAGPPISGACGFASPRISDFASPDMGGAPETHENEGVHISPGTPDPTMKPLRPTGLLRPLLVEIGEELQSQPLFRVIRDSWLVVRKIKSAILGFGDKKHGCPECSRRHRHS